MSLPGICIKRPVTMVMVYAVLIFLGIIALLQLPVELYPNISFGEVSIITGVRGGMPPSEVESLVSVPIEEAVNTVSHLTQIMSISKEGESTVVLSFEPGIDMEFAALEVREKFARVKNKLPKEIDKPVIAQFRRSDVPVLILAITSLRRTTEDIRRIVDSYLKENIKRVSGVADVEVAGGRDRKIVIDIDQRKLVTYNIPLERLISIVGQNNLNLLTGELERADQKYLVRTIGLYETVEQIKNVPVTALPNGTMIRLKDVASVRDAYLEPAGYARVNIRPVISLYVQKETMANTIKVVDDIEKEIAAVKEVMPKDIQLVVTSNQADFIKKAIKNLKDSLLQGACQIMLVLSCFLIIMNRKTMGLVLILLVSVLFLPEKALYIMLAMMTIASFVIKKARPVLIVTSAIPISVIISFLIMWAMKLTLNFMTLFGLALGVGMLVDNSVVVFENILNKNEKGKVGIEGAIAGATEMWVVIWAGTLTHIVVFLPMLFVGEEIKLMYGGVAWTVTISLLVSLFVAVTVVPLLAARTKFSVADIPKGYGDANVVGFMKTLYEVQRKGVLFVMRRRYMVLGGAFVALAISAFLFQRLGMEFLGTTEQNKFTIFIEMPTGAKLEVTNNVVKRVEGIVREIPEVKSFSARVEPWSSKVYVELIEIGKRKRSLSEITDSLRPRMERLKPAFIYFEEEQEVGTKEIVLELYGFNYDTLRELAISLATRLGTIKGFSDTKIRMREGRPELGLKVDRNKAGVVNLTVSTIADQVHAQMRGLRATLFHTKSSEVETIARLDEKYRKTFKDLHKLIITTSDKDNLYLEQLTDFKYGLGPSEVWRKNKSRLIQVSANVGKLPLSKAVELARSAMDDMRFPEGYYYRVGGNYPTMIASQKQFRAIMWLILILIYLVLASLFESYYQPFIIMVSVPLALIGVVISLYVSGKSVGMGVLVGLMMLGGIVVNNGIILIDHVNTLRKGGKNRLKAVIMASRDRLRPILMTTITTLLGLLPMAISGQEGANLWSPLAITVMGGLTSSTILTLLIMPSCYLIFEDAGDRIRHSFTIWVKKKRVAPVV